MQKKFLFLILLTSLLGPTPHTHAMKSKRVARPVVYRHIKQKNRTLTVLSIASVNRTLQNLACNNTHDLLNKNYAQIISDSVVLFHNTPGFIPTLSKFINNVKNNREHIAKGYWYEIITAHRLTTIENQTVLGFNQIIEDPKTKLRREFDLITNKSWIECKNRNWDIVDRLKASRKQLHKQLLDQKKLVELYNKYNSCKDPIEYELCSNQKISPKFKQWLNKHKITYSENS